MIHVKYEKKDNYPHDRETLLFDRSGFQHTHRDVLREINKKYNILCPQVFVMECLAPQNTDKKSDEELEKDKKSLREKLELIENPIVLTGSTNISPVIAIPRGVEYSGILTSEQIARNCILSISIAMERVIPEKLISYYEPKINVLKKEMKAYTEACEKYSGTLTPRRLDSEVQRYFEETHGVTLSREEIRNIRREHERTLITQELEYASREALREMEGKSIEDNIESFTIFFYLTGRDIEELRSQIQDGRRLTTKNYPDLAYPIYVYYLVFFMLCARQHNTQHLDQSYARDFRYLHYLNFCDEFITNESSTRHIVDSLPYSDIRQKPVTTSEELKNRLN